MNKSKVRIAGLGAVLAVAFLLAGCPSPNNSSPASSDATLASLSISGVSLTPAFSPNTLVYQASVPNTTSSAAVTAVAASSKATIGATKEGSPYTLGYSTPLVVGVNDFVITVTAADGTTTKAYTVHLTRGASSDADLASLSVSGLGLSPSFAPSVVDYSAVAPSSTSSVTVSATADDLGATMSAKKGSQAYTLGQATSLATGANDFTITVTAADKSTKVYSLTVTRASSTASSDATLSALAVAGHNLTPAFSSATTSYAVSVDNGTTQASITATRNDSGALVSATKDGAAYIIGQAADLSVGSNVFSILVQAADGTTKKTYVITVTRAPSSDANLLSLTVSGAALSPSFDGGTRAYTANVANSVNSAAVTATARDSGASLSATKDGSAYALGQAVGLSLGPNVFAITVTAADGNAQKTYSVTVTRAAASASKDASLASLAIAGISMAPSFSPSVFTYTASAPYATAVATVTAAKNDAGAVVAASKDGLAYALGQSVALAVGPNVFTIAVTAADGTTSQAYTLTVTRKASDDAALSALSLSGILISPAFSPSVQSYSANVAGTVSTTILSATAHDGGASLAATKGGSPCTVGQSVALAAGLNVFTITVTAADGITIKTYTVTVNKASTGASSDASLASLSSPDAVLGPVFSATVHAYSAYVANSTSTAAVTAAAHDSGAAITALLNGSPYSLGTEAAIGVGTNAFVITVTAADGLTTATYTVTLSRAGPGTGTINVGIILTPSGDLSFTGAGSALAVGQSWLLQPSLAGATAFAWWLDGAQVSTAASYTLSGSSLGPGPHTIGVSATVKGLVYFASLSFVATGAIAPTSVTVSVTLSGVSDLVFTSSTDTISAGQSLVFTPSLSGASSFDWYLDAVKVQSGASYTASADSLAAGPHAITAVAVVSSRTYAGSFYFNVQKTLGPGSLNVIVAKGQAADLSFRASPPRLGPADIGRPVLESRAKLRLGVELCLVRGLYAGGDHLDLDHRSLERSGLVLPGAAFPDAFRHRRRPYLLWLDQFLGQQLMRRRK